MRSASGDCLKPVNLKGLSSREARPMKLGIVPSIQKARNRTERYNTRKETGIQNFVFVQIYNLAFVASFFNIASATFFL
jgi:hypothetical protein